MRVTSQHWEVFLHICEKHPNLITGKFNGAQGKAEGNILWANVASKLNGLGLGEKSVVEWRRAVTDWKSKVKAKACKIKVSATQTGGGPLNTPPLTPLEERLIGIMGKKGFEGDEGIKELGMPLPSQTTNKPQTCENVLEEIEVVTDPCSSGVHHFDKILKNKRQRDEERKSKTHQEAPQESEHTYCGENVAKKRRRVKRKNIPRISKNIEDMTSESVNTLKNIDKNTSRIADSLESVVEILRQKSNNVFDINL